MTKSMISQVLLPLGLALLVLASCTKDEGQEPSSGRVEQTTLSLVAEMPLEEAGTRAAQTIDFEMATNASGQTIPRPKFTDGQKVPVHTILKSSTGEMDIKTVEWTYYADSKTLRLIHGDAGNSFTVANFNNDGGRVWYMAAMIGGELNGTKVEFNGVKVLTETSGQVGDAVGALHVPYYFPWTEVKIQTDREPGLGAGASYSYGLARPADTDPKKKFKPLGSLIGYQLGNAVAGSGARVVESFTVSSNAFADQGTFELDDTPNASTLPVWTPSQCSGAMTYTFASTPPSLSPGVAPSKRYYAWVMPAPTQPAEVRTRVTMRFTTALVSTDVTKTYFTDYVPSATSGGRPKMGKVYHLSANANRNLVIPIQYVAEYNLAGGAGVTYPVTNVSPAPDGSQGELRFSNRHPSDPTGALNPIPHRNDQSGYYTKYYITATMHGAYNPSGVNLLDLTAVDTDGVPRVLGTKYRVPEADDMWGVFSAYTLVWFFLATNETASNTSDMMKVGEGTGATTLLEHYNSEYSNGIVHTGTNEANDAVVYAIRFGKREDCQSLTSTLPLSITRYYTAAPDDAMKCAYRFTRKGGANSWTMDNSSLETGVVIDVVYLGNELTKTTLADISDPSWWSTPGRQVLSRTFPATGNAGGGRLSGRGVFGVYLTSTLDTRYPSFGDSYTLGVRVGAASFSTRQSEYETTATSYRLYLKSPLPR